LKGQRADVARMFSQVSKVPTFIGQWLITVVMIGVPVALYYLFVFFVIMKAGHIALPDLSHLPSRDEMVALVAAVGPPLALATLLAIVPMIWVTLPLMLVPMEIVLTDAGPWECIRRAFALARGFRLPMVGYAIVGSFVLMLGFLACCIGILP